MLSASSTIICVDKHHYNPMGALTFAGVSRKVYSYIPRSKASMSFIGASKVVHQTPLFFYETLAISCVQPIAMFCLAATLCKNGGKLNVMVRSKDIFIPLIVPHPIVEVNCTKAIMAKLDDLPTRPTIDQTNVIIGVVVVHNEEGMF